MALCSLDLLNWNIQNISCLFMLLLGHKDGPSSFLYFVHYKHLWSVIFLHVDIDCQKCILKHPMCFFMCNPQNFILNCPYINMHKKDKFS